MRWPLWTCRPLHHIRQVLCALGRCGGATCGRQHGPRPVGGALGRFDAARRRADFTAAAHRHRCTVSRWPVLDPAGPAALGGVVVQFAPAVADLAGLAAAATAASPSATLKLGAEGVLQLTFGGATNVLKPDWTGADTDAGTPPHRRGRAGPHRVPGGYWLRPTVAFNSAQHRAGSHHLQHGHPGIHAGRANGQQRRRA